MALKRCLEEEAPQAVPAWKAFEDFAVAEYSENAPGVLECYHWNGLPNLQKLVSSGVCRSLKEAWTRFGRRTEGAERRQFGLDGLAEVRDPSGATHFVGIQAKMWREVREVQSLGTFLAVVGDMRAADPRNRGVLVVPHYCKVADAVLSDDRFAVRRVYWEPPADGRDASWPRARSAAPAGGPLELYDFQERLATEFLEAGASGLYGLNEPPGTGKTVVATAVVERERGKKLVVLLAKTKAVLEQTTNRICGRLRWSAQETLSSDWGTEPGPRARAFLDGSFPERAFLSVTFDTWRQKRVAERVARPQDLLVVVDEAHNLGRSAGLWETLRNLSSNGAKVLLMSGTPDLWAYKTHGVRSLAGMSLREHVRAGHLCDYRVALVEEEQQPGEAGLARSEVLARCAYGECLRHGLRNVIVFLKSRVEARAVTSSMRALAERDGYSFFGARVTSETSRSDRLRHREAFSASSADLNVLFSVHILREGIDLPRVDAVLLGHVPKSSSDLAQVLGRACRREEDRPSKVAFMGLVLGASSVPRFRAAMRELNLRVDPLFSSRVRCEEASFLTTSEEDLELREASATARVVTGSDLLILAPTNGLGKHWKRTMDPQNPALDGRRFWGFRSHVIKFQDPMGAQVLFYAKREFHWTGTVSSVTVSTQLSRELWGDDSFDVVVGVSELTRVSAPYSRLGAGKTLGQTTVKEDRAATLALLGL